jgi:hypothetical protein
MGSVGAHWLIPDQYSESKISFRVIIYAEHLQGPSPEMNREAWIGAQIA